MTKTENEIEYDSDAMSEIEKGFAHLRYEPDAMSEIEKGFAHLRYEPDAMSEIEKGFAHLRYEPDAMSEIEKGFAHLRYEPDAMSEIEKGFAHLRYEPKQPPEPSYDTEFGNALHRGGLRIMQGIQQFQFEKQSQIVRDASRSYGDIVGDYKWYPVPAQLKLSLAGGRYLVSQFLDTKIVEKAAQQSAQNVGDYSKRIASIPMSAAAKRAQHKIMTADNDLVSTLKAAADNPLDTLIMAAELGTESVPQLAAAVAVTLVTRNPGAGAVVMGGASGLTERYASATEFIERQGIDLSDPEQALATLLDQDLMQQAELHGFKRGAIIGAFDTLSGGLASKTFGSTLKTLAAQAALQPTLAGTGEGLAQLATDGKINWGEVVMESVADLATAPIEVAAVGGQMLKGRLQRPDTPNGAPEAAQDPVTPDPVTPDPVPENVPDNVTAADIASPIPTDLISAGKAMMDEADGSDAAISPNTPQSTSEQETSEQSTSEQAPSEQAPTLAEWEPVYDSESHEVIGEQHIKTGTFRRLETAPPVADVAPKTAPEVVQKTGITPEIVPKLVQNPAPEPLKTEPVQPVLQEPDPQPVQDTAPVADSGVIDDFGEKIGGARKDKAAYALQLRKDMTHDKKATFAERFPLPNYKKLLSEGVDPQALNLVTLMREQLPKRPKQHYVSSWADHIDDVRKSAASIIDGTMPVDQALAALKSSKRFGEGDVARAFELFKDLPPEDIRLVKGYAIKNRMGNHYLSYNGSIADNTTVSKNLPETLDAARKVIDSVLAQKKAAPNTKQTKLDTWINRNDKKYYIGKKVASRKYIALKSFDTRLEAAQYLDENESALLEELKAKKKLPNMRSNTNQPRVGKDHRSGANTTPDTFTKTFRFRGVEFGNWVEQDRRRDDLNDAFDALSDMADVINVPRDALSLKGGLGLAFGARGRGGNVAAHFEPSRVVINLTKTGGKGSLAHEWWHALDNYFGSQSHTKDYLSEGARKGAMGGGNSVRMEVVEAFQNIREVIQGSNLLKRSQNLDKTRTKDHYSTVRELTARTFERYVIDKLAEQGVKNDYLANVATQETYDHQDYPYPTDVEAKTINKAFDELFQKLKVRETDNGVKEIYQLKKDGQTPDDRSKLQRRKRSTVYLTGKELNERNAKSKIQDAAYDFYKKNLQGTRVAHPVLGDVYFSDKGAGKFKTSGAQKKKLKLVIKLPEIIRKGVLIETVENDKFDDKNIKFFHKLLTPVELAGESKEVLVTIFEDGRGNKFYNLTWDYDPKVRNPAASKGLPANKDWGRGGDRASKPKESETGLETNQVVQTPSDKSRLTQKDDLINVQFVDDLNDIRKPADFKAAKAELEARLAEVKLDDKVRVKLVNDFYSVVTGQKVDADGRYMRGLIEVALDAGDKKRTLNHEIIHALRDLGLFSTSEWNALKMTGKRRLKSVRKLYADQNLSEDALMEEAIAESYADWAAGTGPKVPELFSRRAFDKLKQLFERIRSALRGQGFISSADVFRAVETGEVGSRVQAGEQVTPPNDFESFRTVQLDPSVEKAAERTAEGEKFALRKPTARIFAKDIDRILANDTSISEIPVLATGHPILIRLGFPRRPLVMKQTELNKVLRGKHGAATDTEVVKRLPELITDPIMIVYDKENKSLVHVLDARNNDGERMLAAVRPSITLSRNKVDLVLTAFGKSRLENWLKAAQQQDRVVYIDQEKSARLLHWSQDQSSGVSQSSTSRRILTKKDFVKEQQQSEKFALREKSHTMLAQDFGQPNASAVELLRETQAPIWQRVRAASNKRAIAEQFDRLRHSVQDSMLPLRRIQGEIERKSGVLSEDMDAYMKETLYAGRVGARMDDMTDLHLEPLIDDMTAQGVSMDELETYLYARHAGERNAYIASINPEFADGSGAGMTDSEATAILQAVKNSGKEAKLKQLATRVDGFQAAMLQARVDDGLLSETEAAQLKKRWKYYVPLKGPAEMTAGAELDTVSVNTSTGKSVKGKEFKHAFGRKSRAGEIIPHIFMAGQEAIIRGEKNRVAKAFYDLAKSHPNSDLWTVNKKTQKAYFDKATGQISYRTDPIAAEDAPYTVSAKVNGDVVRVVMNRDNPAAVRLATAIRNLDGEKMSFVVQMMSKATRFLSAINTSYNPEFVISNALRDLQTGLTTAQQFDAEGMTKKIIQGWLPAMLGAEQGAFKTGNSEWRPWFDEYTAAGGRVYFNQMHDVDALRTDLQKKFKESGKSKMKRTLSIRALGKTIEKVNLGVESAVRLSVYRHLRETGMSKDKSAAAAKELTVNFNRKGTMGPVINSFYMFFNAGVQGTFTLARAAKASRKVRVALGGIVVTGALMEIFNQLWSPEDEDGEKKYDKIGAHEKSRNFILYLPNSKQPIELPMGYGLNFFYHLGRAITEVGMGRDVMDAVAEVATTGMEAFNPIGGAGSFVKQMSPTLLDPAMELALNEDFAGRAIMPTRYPHHSGEPEHLRHFKSVSPTAKAIAKGLNDATGGNSVEPGAIDISPETIEHWFSFITGSAGRTAQRFVDIPSIIADPEREITSKDIPFARKLIGASNFEWKNKQRFYERTNAVMIAKKRLEKLKEEGRARQAYDFNKENKKLLTLHSEAMDSVRYMRRLRKHLSQLHTAKELGHLSQAEYAANIKPFQQEVKTVVNKFNTLYYTAFNEE